MTVFDIISAIKTGTHSEPGNTRKKRNAMAMDRKKSHLSSKKIRNQDTMSSRERILYSLTEFSIKKESRETMQYTTHYQSPLGDLLLAADDEGLTGI